MKKNQLIQRTVPCMMQKLGAINPYNISVTFKITMSEATINE